MSFQVISKNTAYKSRVVARKIITRCSIVSSLLHRLAFLLTCITCTLKYNIYIYIYIWPQNYPITSQISIRFILNYIKKNENIRYKCNINIRYKYLLFYSSIEHSINLKIKCNYYSFLKSITYIFNFTQNRSNT